MGFASWAASEFATNDAGRADRAALLAEFEKFPAEAPHAILVIEVDGEPAGWGAREHGDHVISDLWIAPQFRGIGLGGNLLTALEAEIAAMGLPDAELETLATNYKAIRFYERHGFRVVWRGEKFSSPLGYAIDKVRMNKSLSL
ncbi:GNAT family N-acetyltransferase [Devosia oryziradicis]|uniref:GNAT family N-acetyltransferase n=1 Tax=Devosia oryziradicis TaxID=2801335 RepID=A0ABX7BVG2_9HYPH|nr:GNAT family N-acetyltransferase [Devosia oryziradicis]QQR35034.1 GNAT family N-acetyltransferase [Devosia oryziradicis]